jgi:oxygen-independent coproporphyrinogen-3 oxidase
MEVTVMPVSDQLIETMPVVTSSASHRYPLSLYLHIPFCEARCTYCDFNTYAGLDGLKPAYTRALATEIQRAGQAVSAGGEPLPVRTIFLGGGTPTTLDLAQLATVLDACRVMFAVSANAEVTSEANPGTLEPGYLVGLRRMGINRLSLGVQSFDDGLLSLLGRIHTAAEAVATIHDARQAGFDNLSLDLIYGLPLQTLDQWRETVMRALDLEPDHLSCYALTVEDPTPLYAQVMQGKLPWPDPDLAADMYDLTREMLAEAGFVHYEISNWGKVACRHNLTYWHNEPYLGFGAGAHSWFGGRRFHDILNPRQYIRAVKSGRWPVAWRETISPSLEMAETAILGLRLVQEGIEQARFRARFGRDLDEVFGRELTELKALKLIEETPERVTLAPAALLIANQVFVRLLPDDEGPTTNDEPPGMDAVGRSSFVVRPVTDLLDEP